MGVLDSKLLILRAINRAIRPIVRLMIHWGIGYKDFSESMKQAFLEEASESIKRQDKDVTASDLSLVSGIHRKDSSAFIKQDKSTDEFKPKLSAAFTVFSEWISHPDYQQKKGVPAALHYSNGDKCPSFTELCESVTSDIRPKAILDELQRLELIELKNDFVYLKKDAFIPEKDLENQLDFFTRNISEHIETSASNIIGKKPPMFERMASHGQLTEQDIAKLKEYVDKKGMELLKNVYQRAEKLAEKNKTKGESTHHFSLGVYLHHKEESDQ